MPQLPKSMLLPHTVLKKNQEYYSAHARMAIRPEDTITLTHKDNTTRDILNTLVNIHPERAHTDEYQHKKLFFQKVETLCAQDGYTINAKQMFCKNDDGKTYGSQGLLMRVNFSNVQTPQETQQDHSIRLNESTTPFVFVFNFIGGSQNQQENKTIAPIYLIDDRFLSALENAGIHDEKIESLCTDFMLLAACADHDYMHGMTLEHREGLPYSLDNDIPFYDIALEKYTLGLHAKVFHQLFKDRPKRKDHYLSYVRNSLTHILDIQKHLSADAATPQDRQRNTDIITHLAEIHAHRIFRVVSPDDIDLDKTATPNESSINNLFNAIDIHVPMDKLDTQSRYIPNMSNKEKLLLNLSIIDKNAPALRPGMYRDIHGIKIIDADYGRQKHSEQHSLTEIMGDFFQVSKGVSKEQIRKCTPMTL